MAVNADPTLELLNYTDEEEDADVVPVVPPNGAEMRDAVQDVNGDAANDDARDAIEHARDIVPPREKPVRCREACASCVQGCCVDCMPLDWVLLAVHGLLIGAAAVQQGFSIKSKLNTHNQCYLMATYFREGSMDYTKSLLWCDATLYGSSMTLMLAFLFIMVNWTAQLNRNKIWMGVKALLHLAGLSCTAGACVALLLAYKHWCTQLQDAHHHNHDHPRNHTDGSCLDDARYFDVDKNEDTTLQTLHKFTTSSLVVGVVCSALWLIACFLTIAHSCVHVKQDTHDYNHLEEDDDPADDLDAFVHPEREAVDRDPQQLPHQAAPIADL